MGCIKVHLFPVSVGSTLGVCPSKNTPFSHGDNVRLKVFLFSTSGGCESSLGQDLLLHNKGTGCKVQRKDSSLPTLANSSLSGGHHRTHVHGNWEIKSAHSS